MSAKAPIYPRFFSSVRIGESLKEVSSDVMKVESRDIIGRWFHSADEIDLFIWTDESKTIVKQQLTFYGQVVEWNVVEGTKTGVIIEEEDGEMDEAGGIKASEMIRFDTKPQARPLGLAMDVIQHTHALTGEEQKQVIANFFRGQKYDPGLESEFLKKFPKLKMPRPPSRLRRLWNSLLQKVRRSQR